MGGVSNPSVLNVDPSQAIFNAFKLQGREIADTAPTDGQALIWSVVQNKWVPGAGGAGSVSWDDINGRPDLSVYALASALNNYVLGANLATILGIYVTNSGLSTALNDYLQTSNFTWANLGDKPDLDKYKYIRVSPRARELDSVLISTAGQNYNLASIPQTGNYLVHCILYPGMDNSTVGNPLLLAFAAPSDDPKPSPSAPSAYAHHGTAINTDAGTDYQSGLQAGVGPRHIWVPAENGQIWAIRSGTYFGSTHQTSLEVLGYQGV
jgi:hypothetical protein